MVLLTYLVGEDTKRLERWPLKVALHKAEEWCNDILKFARIRDDPSCKILYECDVHGLRKIENKPGGDRHRRALSVTDES